MSSREPSNNLTTKTMKLKLLFFLVLLFALVNYSTKKVFAADFDFAYDVSYTVATSSRTRVDQNITITNRVSNYYTSKYTLVIASDNVENVQASDPMGEIIPEVTRTSRETSISLIFNAKVVGQNQKLKFKLSYDSLDIAQKKGRIWEVIIPGIDKTEEIADYTVRLTVPPDFGQLAYRSPQSAVAGVWTWSEFGGRGITVAYGDYQNFNYNLIYHLENLNSRAEIQEITLPPDTELQKVVINRLSELPLNVKLDRDGNWLAQYRLNPREKKKIVAEGNILIFPNFQLPAKKLSAAEVKLYTQSQPYWEQTPEIKALAQKLKTPRAIYDYVVNTLNYDYQRLKPGIERLGATKALASPQSAVCTEFSDLFIALARTAGIPARELHGYAYTTNSRLQPLSLGNDILHAWPEYYDEVTKTWIQVDPTWENTTKGVDYFTKLDFNHIAFAILGEKSDYPYPAGAFKGDTDTKDVFMDFSNTPIDLPEPQYQVRFDFPTRAVSGQKLSGKIRLQNTGSVLLEPKNADMTTTLKFTSSLTEVTAVPPFGTLEIPFKVTSEPAFKTSTGKIELNLNGSQFDQTVTLRPFYWAYLPWAGFIFVAILVSFVILGRHGPK